MSDFLFASRNGGTPDLPAVLRETAADPAIRIFEYSGDWGTLAIAHNHYAGFDPMEDERYILCMIGGPLLRLEGEGEPPMLPDTQNNAGSRRLLTHWQRRGQIAWDSELSGPFAAIRVDKVTAGVELVTDLFSFVQVYAGEQCDGAALVLGSNPDAVAFAAGRFDALDEVSLADLVVNQTVCYPYTLYQGVRQLSPATVFRWHRESDTQLGCDDETYWLPREVDAGWSLDEAAARLRDAIVSSVAQVCDGHERVALFLSGGEDSRSIAGALPAGIEKHGFIFVDRENRESLTARAVARRYGIEPHVGTRTLARYINNLPACTRMVGAQNEFVHVHAFGYHQDFRLDRYPAVLGGLTSDVFFKGLYIPSEGYAAHGITLPRHRVPQPRSFSAFSQDANYPGLAQAAAVVRGELVEAVMARRLAHYDRVVALRPDSATEWTMLWPYSQATGCADLGGNRRLFRSYEPFMDAEVVKISAAVPTEWKINRRLFQKAMQPLLARSRFLPHATTGHLPYYPAGLNVLWRFLVVAGWKLRKLFDGKAVRNQGPWPIYQDVVGTEAMARLEADLLGAADQVAGVFSQPVAWLMSADALAPLQRLLLAQLLWSRQHLFADREA